ncbi:guanitoxin biosynthesis L-arginine gamma (S) hydroxylase [Nostoc sp. 'Peltigera membranacea cyanobiont' 232]|uniref:guanitoxin biosynthesis L-arginine gamma (S) hydroxylase n=1 Tax=Nostoc sp. 'Peltigera membranacea cyanobiont' 232 TaxID=2014531 RepID=UPI00167B6C4D|nr:guanitoxin biosynthesis L-arginine gamma (S) hydroxylase [Nostoc sp. 'Peltigera membranacea cyanobiont' 232]
MNTAKIKVYEFEDPINQQIKKLIDLDNWHSLLALLKNYAFILASVLITYQTHWYGYPLAVLVIGSRQRALATLLHEAAHKTLARNRWLNLIVGSFCSGYLILQTITAYRQSHVRYHHGHFGDPELDPDYKLMLEEGLYDHPVKLQSFALKHLLAPLFLSKVPVYLYSLVRHRLWDGGDHLAEKALMLAYVTSIVAGATFLGLGKVLLLFWVVPYLTTFQIIGWFIELNEHFPLMQNDCNLYMARNRHSHWLESFFTGMHNESYHLVHHLNPALPFWNQVKAHQVYLQDYNYTQQDTCSGGIFISSNGQPSFVMSLLNLK